MLRNRSTLAAALAVAAGLAVCTAGPAAARTLHWSLLDVDATLDADGALRVTETHHMVFDGAWNGGERRFDLRPGQEIEDFSIARIDPQTEYARELVRGDLDRVDHYDWTDSTTVRWRSRRPSDPPFADRTLIYRLDYRLTGVLYPREEGASGGEGIYEMLHDFAFPARSGVIEHYVLDLEIDPAFQVIGQVPQHLERENLPPGAGALLGAELRYLEAGRPAAAAPASAPLAVRLLLIVFGAGAGLWMLVQLYRAETEVGRTPGKLPRSREVDRAWIERELTPLPAEVVGALWDRRVGPPEVSALIARLVGEGKLESSVERNEKGKEEMRLRMVAPVDDFRGGYEAKLVSKLFFADSREVTTSELERHYRKTGFDPVAVIRPKLEKRVEKKVPAARAKRPAPPKLPALLLSLAALACFAIEAATRPAVIPGLAVPLFGVVPVLYVFSLSLALALRRQIEWLIPAIVGFLIPLLAMALGSALFIFLPGLAGPVPIGLFGTLALVLANLTAWRSITHVARTPEAPEAIAARRKLILARRHFEAELKRKDPDLDDAWFPYLLAFGLSSELDRWSRAFGGEAAGATALAAAGATSYGRTLGGSSGSSGGGFTGGGGQFGGAGASAAWATAATGLAAGVAPPSSSSGGFSGGGGGGGGGSSGGGGGWGW